TVAVARPQVRRVCAEERSNGPLAPADRRDTMPIDPRVLLICALAAARPVASLAADHAAPAADDTKAEAPALKSKRPGRAAVPPPDRRGVRRGGLAAKRGASRARDADGEGGVRGSTQPGGELQLPAQTTPERNPGAAKPAAKAVSAHGSAHWSYEGEGG